MKKNQFTILLVILFLVAGIIPLGIIGRVSVKCFHTALMDHALSQLQAVRESRKRQVETYFAAREVEMDVLTDILSTWRKDSPNNQELEAWVNTHSPFLKKYKERYNYYDLYLIRPDGYYFYSVAVEADYGTNLMTGQYANSGLGKLVRKVSQTKEFGFADVEPYAPSNNEPSAFMAQPIVQNGEIELIVAFHLSLEPITTIMQQREGLGETGETYLVGSDKLMRSDSYLDPENHSVRASFAVPTRGKVDTEAVRDALSGNTGEKIILDYNGNKVLSAYAPIHVGDTTWGVIAEFDETEVVIGAKNLKQTLVILSFVCLLPILVIVIVISRVVPVTASGAFSPPPIRESLIEIRTLLDKLIEK